MKKEGVIWLFLILLIGIASASYQLGNPSYKITKTTYVPGEKISGWVNISFSDEDGDSVLLDSNGQSMPVIELMKKNTGYSYECSIPNCEIGYSAQNNQASKQISLGVNDSEVIGFKFTGKLLGINSVKFNLDSDAGLSCYNQVKLDFFEDGKYEIGNNESSPGICGGGKNYGCYQTGDPKEEYTLGPDTPYCQRIKFPEAPSFTLGAWIKKIGNGSSHIELYIYDGDQYKVFCRPPDPTNPNGEQVECGLDFLITGERDYYICLFADDPDFYKTRGNINPEDNQKCGFYGEPVLTPTSAYEIYIQPKMFASFPLIKIDNSFSNGNDVPSAVEDYLKNKYPGLNCPEDGCLVPINVGSNISQNIDFSNLEISYEKEGGVTTSSEFYDFEKTFSQVSAGFQQLSLDNGVFYLPNKSGNYTFELRYDGNKVISEKIYIQEVPTIKSLYPTTTALGYPTQFVVDVSSGTNITKYKWNFGNESVTTSVNNIFYTFKDLGIYNVTIEVSDKNNFNVTRKFSVNVTTPEKQIEQMISDIKASLNQLKVLMNEFDSFERNSIDMMVDINAAEETLAEAQKRYDEASTNEHFIRVIELLLSVEIPQSIRLNRISEPLLFFPKNEEMNLDLIESVGGTPREVGYDDAYKEALLAWHQNTIETRVIFKEVNAMQDGVDKPIIRFFEIQIEELKDLDYSPYLFIKNMENLKFSMDYGETEDSGYYYIELGPGKNSFRFSTTEDLTFVDLPIFISPPINELTIITECTGEECEEKAKNKWWFFALVILGLLVGGYIIYAILYNWYKNRYEKHLFKDRNNLFNLVNYINNQKIKGIDEVEIADKLKAAKWSSEQIDYVMRKYIGKRTGMLKLPFLDSFSDKRLKQPQIQPSFRPGYIQPRPGFERNYGGI